MESFLGISYKLTQTENFDEYMKAIGVGLITRKMGNAVTPTISLTEKDGVYTFTTTSAFKNQTITFKPNVEFDEETPDGRKVKTEIKFEGNKMIQVQKGALTTTIVREFTDRYVKAVFTIGDVVSTRTYERVD